MKSVNIKVGLGLALTVALANLAFSQIRSDDRRLAVGLQLTLTPKDSVFGIGRPALIHVHLENRSSATYKLPQARAYIAVRLRLQDAAGSDVRISRSGERLLAGSVFGPDDFPPGAIYDEEEDISRLFDIKRPGMYTVSGSRAVEAYAPIEAPPASVVYVEAP